MGLAASEKPCSTREVTRVKKKKQTKKKKNHLELTPGMDMMNVPGK